MTDTLDRATAALMVGALLWFFAVLWNASRQHEVDDDVPVTVTDAGVIDGE